MLEQAIVGSNGLILTVAQRLKVSRTAVRNYLERWPELEEMLDEEREDVLDFAESKLFMRLQEGEAWAIKYMLSNQGRGRGYGKRSGLQRL